MPATKGNNSSRRPRQTEQIMFGISKRTADPSFKTSPSKKSRHYIIDSDEFSSDQDVESDIVHVSRESSFTKGREVVDEDTTDSDTIVVLAQQPEEKWEEIDDEVETAKTLFHSMPIEIHQKIAEFLPTDSDVARYSRVCRRCHQSITVSVWRLRFLQTFDHVPNTGPTELANKYASRRAITKLFTKFDLAIHASSMNRSEVQIANRNQQLCLDMLKNLIIESNARKIRNADGNELVVGNNLDYIRGFVSYVPGTKGNVVDIVDAILKTEKCWDVMTVCSVDSSPDTLVMVIQLCLTPISWDPRYCNNSVSHFDWSQFEVYAAPQQQPVFVGQWKNDLNVQWCLHVANFFKFHLKAKNGEGVLAHAFAALSQDQLPRAWLGRLQQGTQKLESNWKGAYFYLDRDELTRMRLVGGKDGGLYLDELNGGEFQDISIFFDEQKFGKASWPAAWEEILKSDPFSKVYVNEQQNHGPRRSTRSRKVKQHKEIPSPGVKYFYGSSQDSREAHFYGVVHGIPTQHGIPGFQRVTMMKFFPDHNGHYDPGQVWAYEGCVLPGGSIIVGRWWDATAEAGSDVFSGPFVFWNVESSEADMPMDGEDALHFLKMMSY
ncbi:hypothetical protein ACMFMF_000755 [Clarireedia jacksonii]